MLHQVVTLMYSFALTLYLTKCLITMSHIPPTFSSTFCSGPVVFLTLVFWKRAVSRRDCIGFNANVQFGRIVLRGILVFVHGCKSYVIYTFAMAIVCHEYRRLQTLKVFNFRKHVIAIKVCFRNV